MKQPQAPEVGRRIRLLKMVKDPDPIPPGSIGVVLDVHYMGDLQYVVRVKWDGIKRSLNLLIPTDTWEYAD